MGVGIERCESRVEQQTSQRWERRARPSGGHWLYDFRDFRPKVKGTYPFLRDGERSGTKGRPTTGAIEVVSIPPTFTQSTPNRSQPMRTRAWIALPLLLAALMPARLEPREPTRVKSKVPSWDARGLGPLPWQGVACLDVNDDATRIALGTIAPPGDPNVLLLDGDGKLLRQQAVGQRWINQVALGQGNALWAVCTMPAGRSGDLPEAFRLSA